MNNNKQMKFILERWDKFVLNEEEAIAFKKIPTPPTPINEIGELRAYFAANATSNTKQGALKMFQKAASTHSKALGISVSILTGLAAASLGAVVTPALGVAAVGAAIGAGVSEVAKTTVQELVNGVVIDTMVNNLGIQLMAIPDADRNSWGDIAVLFDINDKVFQFLLKAYGGKIPKEVSDASEQLKNDIISKIDDIRIPDTKRITDVFNGFETIQQRVDRFIQANHQVKIEPAQAP